MIFVCLFIEGAMRHEDVNEEPPSRGTYKITVLSIHGSILLVYVRDGATERSSMERSARGTR